MSEEALAKLDSEQLEWYDVLMSGMRLRKPANEARRLGTSVLSANRRFRKLLTAMRAAGLSVKYEPFKVGRYTYSTYRLMDAAITKLRGTQPATKAER